MTPIPPSIVCVGQAAPQHLETQLAAAEVYGRKGKALLEAAAVKRAVELAGRQHPDVHRALVKLGQRGERHRLTDMTARGLFGGGRKLFAG